MTISMLPEFMAIANRASSSMVKHAADVCGKFFLSAEEPTISEAKCDGNLASY